MAAVAPMDLVVKGDGTSIPLRCTLCPKKPQFSDLSHLLTHISSKSHLAHRFKAELKARDDQAASEEVHQYDMWCERYGINALLAERMAAKEQKRTGRRGRPSNQANTKTGISVGRQALVKPDPEEYSATLATAGHWMTGTAHLQDSHDVQFDNSVYQTPTFNRSRSDRSAPSTPENEGRAKYYRRWPSETETTDSLPVSELPSESTEFLDDDTDISKLKGVRYPGMGLFDSADEIQKRMRNQRKDDSVLKSMEQASTGIEPNEFVWAENGEFQRVRDIYASPSIEGSPQRKLEARDAPKPKRGRRPATAAALGSLRQTRASARVTRQRAARKRGTRDVDASQAQDDDDNSGIIGSGDSYDIFRDPPKPDPARTESPLSDHGFGIRRRPALQQLNSNLSMASSAEKPTKSISYISAREAATAAFTPQPAVSSGHYFQQHHAMGAGTFNPLCVQARGGFYNPYGYSTYGNDSKPAAANFQAINSMNMGAMSFNAFGGPYVPDPAHERVDQDFGL